MVALHITHIGLRFESASAPITVVVCQFIQMQLWVQSCDTFFSPPSVEVWCFIPPSCVILFFVMRSTGHHPHHFFLNFWLWLNGNIIMLKGTWWHCWHHSHHPNRTWVLFSHAKNCKDRLEFVKKPVNHKSVFYKNRPDGGWSKVSDYCDCPMLYFGTLYLPFFFFN